MPRRAGLTQIKEAHGELAEHNQCDRDNNQDDLLVQPRPVRIQVLEADTMHGGHQQQHWNHHHNVLQVSAFT